jgi:hypothetical protein
MNVGKPDRTWAFSLFVDGYSEQHISRHGHW